MKPPIALPVRVVSLGCFVSAIECADGRYYYVGDAAKCNYIARVLNAHKKLCEAVRELTERIDDYEATADEIETALQKARAALALVEEE